MRVSSKKMMLSFLVKQSSLSKAELARKLGITRRALSRWCNMSEKYANHKPPQEIIDRVRELTAWHKRLQ